MVSLDGRHAKQKMGSRAHVVRERSELALESICFVLNSCFLFLFLSASPENSGLICVQLPGILLTT